MNQKYLRLSLLLVLVNFVAGANAKIHFETRICRGCDYNHAMNTAAQIKPAINCTGSDDPFNSGTVQGQACYATPINIMVIDADSRNMWRFENTYANQGQPIYNLTNEVNYHSLISADAIKLAQQLLDLYEAIHQQTVALTTQLNSQNKMALRSTATDSDPCENYEFAQALSDAFNGRLKSNLQH